ncbi:MAG: AraC family transcriptional regulator [Ruminococcus sp.]|nr:AraC family transcriptional regulator [Ruminococcus sp.]
MDWVKEFQSSIDYIEDHITEPLNYEKIAEVMHLSGFYYQKIFSILCGISLGEYIRNRRLSLAGGELLTTEDKIIDIALKYGYDTPEGFTRAFTRFHGATPNAVRKKQIPIKFYAKLTVSILVKGGSSMNYKIEKKEAFKIIAKTQRFDKIEDVLGRKDIPEFWQQCHSDGTVKYLIENCKKDGVLGSKVVGMCMEDSVKVKDFPYSIGAEYAGGDVPDGYNIVDIPSASWIIFDAAGSVPDAIQKLWHSIFAEFFPSSDYKPCGNLDIEVYSSDNYHAEIWIAVEKK